MEQNRKKKFPWALAVFLCLYITLTALGVTALTTRADTLGLTDPTQPLPAEPDHEVVFRQLFAQPDWAQLYALAGETDTEFEGGEAFAAYMTERVGEKELTYFEVYTEIADSQSYLVCLGDEKVAAFTMAGGELQGVELYYVPALSVTVETPPEYTVFVNGVALDESYTVRTAQTKAEDYLSEGLHGQRWKWQTVDGLLAQPQVTAVDENGQPVQMQYDEQACIYRPVQQSAPELTEEIAQLARKAAIADAGYAIGAISNTQLKVYFDEQSALYKLLTTNNRNLQYYISAAVDESTMEVGEFCRYSDTLYSINVKLTQKIVRGDGTLRIYTADKTYFFTLRDGQYRVTDYTYEHMTERVEQVRLRFVTDGGASSQMVGAGETVLTLPAVEAPQGQILLGWATKAVKNGTVTMTVRVLPDGTVLGDLDPMELYPVFETP